MKTLAATIEAAQAGSDADVDALIDQQFDARTPEEIEAERQFEEVSARYADVLRAHADGAPLPAPNGRPSKLNARQWVQVRTPLFKAWYGDWEDPSAPAAKTRDPATGEPRVAFHGSIRFEGSALGDIEQFDREASMKIAKRKRSIDTIGNWFSSESHERGAGLYSGTKGAVIYPAMLNIRNPYVVTNHDAFFARGRGDLSIALREELIAAGHDGVYVPRTNQKALEAEVAAIRKAIEADESKTYIEIDGVGSRSKRMALHNALKRRTRKREEDIEAIKPRMRANGGSEFDEQEAWVAFHPEQIKSAVGNPGTFGPTGAILDGIALPEALAKADSANDASIDDLLEALLNPPPEPEPEPVTPSLQVDLSDYPATLWRMIERLDAHPDDPTVLLYVQSLSNKLQSLPRSKLGPVEAWADPLRALQAKVDARRPQAADPAFDRRLFDDFMAQGDDYSEAPAALAKAKESETASLSKALEITERFTIAENEAIAPFEGRIQELRDLMRQLASDEARFDEWEAARIELNALTDRRYDAAQAVRTVALAELAENRKMVSDQIATIGAPVISKLLAESKVSEAEAAAWAEAQDITPTARARLKKLNYPLENVRRDMAEFHRLTGGRLATIVLDSEGGRRANAQGIHGHASSIIAMGSNFTKRTLFHEMAHHLEADPVVLRAATAFLAKRRKSETPVSLRKLVKNSGYRSDEKAYDDAFFNAYVGKVYPDATEVLSMGVESFHSGEVLAHRLAADPEMFQFITGVMRAPVPQDYQTIRDFREDAVQVQKEKATQDARDWDTALAEYVADVVVLPDTLSESSELMRWVWNQGTVKSIGMVDQGGSNYWLFEASKVRDIRTRRQKRGHLWLEVEKNGGWTRVQRTTNGLPWLLAMLKSGMTDASFGRIDMIKPKVARDV